MQALDLAVREPFAEATATAPAAGAGGATAPISIDGAAHAALVSWLSTPAAQRPTRVERVQTHFAWVFLTPTRAYKPKKPVSVYGSDLRSLAAREHARREELRLNRRLADRTYLGVRAIHQHDGALSFDLPGPIVDWVVEMRRLDAAHMLDARLHAGTASTHDLRAVIAHLLCLDRDPEPWRQRAGLFLTLANEILASELGES